MAVTKQKKKSVPKKAQLAGKDLLTPKELTIRQQQPHWCWAACVSVVLSHHHQLITQCALANSLPALKGNDCCAFKHVQCYVSGTGPSNVCDIPQTNPEISNLFTFHGIGNFVHGPLDSASLTAQLTAGNLVGIAIDWQTGLGGHMLLAFGWKGQKFMIFDPCAGNGPLTHHEIEAYDAKGTWVDSWKEL